MKQCITVTISEIFFFIISGLLTVLNFFTGRRSCIGETLARPILLLTFANIMQKFKIRLPSGAVLPDPSNYTLVGVNCYPPPFDIEAIPRTNE